jgi:hypothetical protein
VDPPERGGISLAYILQLSLTPTRQIQPLAVMGCGNCMADANQFISDDAGADPAFEAGRDYMSANSAFEPQRGKPCRMDPTAAESN